MSSSRRGFARISEHSIRRSERRLEAREARRRQQVTSSRRRGAAGHHRHWRADAFSASTTAGRKPSAWDGYQNRSAWYRPQFDHRSPPSACRPEQATRCSSGGWSKAADQHQRRHANACAREPRALTEPGARILAGSRVPTSNDSVAAGRAEGQPGSPAKSTWWAAPDFQRPEQPQPRGAVLPEGSRHVVTARRAIDRPLTDRPVPWGGWREVVASR